MGIRGVKGSGADRTKSAPFFWIRTNLLADIANDKGCEQKQIPSFRKTGIKKAEMYCKYFHNLQMWMDLLVLQNM